LIHFTKRLKMLLVGGAEVQETHPLEETVLLPSDTLTQVSREFANTSVTRLAAGNQKYVYINQREMAVAKQNDPSIDILGSEDATTCLIIVLRDRRTHSCGIIHLDSPYEEQISPLVNEMQKLDGASCSQEFDTFVIGGYRDERGMSEEIIETQLCYLKQSKNSTFHLKLLCVQNLNTVIKAGGVPWPVHYGAAVRLSDGAVFPARFDSYEPDKDIRMLRMHSEDSDGFLNVYDAGSGDIVIPAFSYTPRSNAHLWIQAEDELILSRCSTSPKVEPPHFVQDFKNVFRRMLTDPDPSATIFKGGRSRRYKRNEASGKWELLNPEYYPQGKQLADPNQPRAAAFNVRDFMSSVKKC